MKYQRSYRRWWRHPHAPPAHFLYKVKGRYLFHMKRKHRLEKTRQ